MLLVPGRAAFFVPENTSRVVEVGTVEGTLMAMRALLGIDLGTSSLKALLVREDGRVLGSCGKEYPILTPSVGRAEQEPAAWWLAVTGAVNRLLSKTGVVPRDIVAIGLSGQMHGMVPLDESREVVRPAIIWCDQRAREYVDLVYRTMGKEAFSRITLNPLSPGFQLATLLWMRDHEPENYRKIDTVILPKDYVRYRLTGSLGSEITDASSTLVFDTSARQWSQEIIEALDLDKSHFPICSQPLDIVGGVTAAAAAETGLAVGTPVIAGGSDQTMQAIGNGLTAPGTLSLTTGTGGQLFSVVERPVFNPALNTHTFCNVLPGTWYVMAATLSAGLSLSWFMDAIAFEQGIEKLAAESAAVPPGSEGAFFLPYLAGERTPHLDPEARALFYGLTLRHTRAHMTRAIMEGVAYSYRDCLTVLENLGIRAQRIIGSGGGARSPLWLQIQSDVLGREISITGITEQASFGAALAAGAGVGMFADIPDACARMLPSEGRVTRPDPARSRVYDKCYPIYRDLYQSVRQYGPRLAELDSLDDNAQETEQNERAPSESSAGRSQRR
jgi:xylulokinase